jgi:pilus assembly protein CpaF
MRPDRIIVGEVRGGEVAEMLQAMNTGHPGSMSTGHGNTAEGMLKRLEAMYLMSVSLNIDAIREQIAEGIDVMVHIRKDRNGARHISEIKEILGYESGKFILNDIMSRDSKGIVNLEKAVNGGERYAEILSCGLPDRDGGGVHIL